MLVLISSYLHFALTYLGIILFSNSGSVVVTSD